MSARRTTGTGSLTVWKDKSGCERWYGQFWVDGRRVKRAIGPRRAPGTTDGLTRAQAEAALRTLMVETKPRTPASPKLTMEELGRRYLTHLERQGRKLSTRTAVNSTLTVWLIPFFGDRDLAAITVRDVEDLMTLMEAGTKPGPRQPGDRRWGKPVGAKSVRNYIGTLSAMLRFAQKKEFLAYNVAERVDLPAAEATDPDIRFLTPDEVRVLADRTCAGPYRELDRALYLTAAMTGLRQGELVALRWRDVDWPAQRIRVRQNHVLGEFGTPKSRRSSRSVPLAAEVAGELARLQQRAKRTGENDLVFADPLTGGPMDKAAILRRYKRALKAALIIEHRFHDLRHTFGTAMAATGVPMRTLQEWMGHRDIETTQRYADYAPSAREAEFIAQAFSARADTPVFTSPGIPVS